MSSGASFRGSFDSSSSAAAAAAAGASSPRPTPATGGTSPTNGAGRMLASLASMPPALVRRTTSSTSTTTTHGSNVAHYHYYGNWHHSQLRLARVLLVATFAMLLVHQSRLAYVHQSSTDRLHLDLLYHNALAASHLMGATTTTTADNGGGIRGGFGIREESPTWNRTTEHRNGDQSDNGRRSDGPTYAAPLPAIVPSDTSVVDQMRKSIKLVAGMGDPAHLGGLVDFPATQSISPSVFQLVRSQWGATSLLDVGCGRGWSASWFKLQGVATRCVEASPDVLRRSLLPKSSLVNHDFTRGPWRPSQTVDVAWCTSFLQQVPKPHMRNYMEALRSAAIVLVSVPTTKDAAAKGWHSVEIHSHVWWIVHFERYGFVLSLELTTQVRDAARLDASQGAERGPDREPYRTSDLAIDSMVFLNPSVSSLPQHDHLFPEIGCVDTNRIGPNGTLVRRECGYGRRGKDVEQKLDVADLPPLSHNYLTDKWFDLVKKNLLDGERHPLPEDEVLPGASDPVVAAAPHSSTQDLLSRHAVTVIPQLVDAGNVDAAIARQIPMVVWPLWELKAKSDRLTAEVRHFEMNGVEESPFMELSHDPNNFHPDVVWVGNTGYGHGWSVWCHKFREHVTTAQAKRRRLGLPTSWPIVIVDFTDYDVRQRCEMIEDDVGAEFVTYTKRSMARDRHWNHTTNWVDGGFRRPDRTPHNGVLYRHTPLAVRTDTVQYLVEALASRNLTLRDNIEALHRPVDVTHLWPTDANVTKSVGTVESNLRTTVSFAITDLGRSTPDLNVHVGLAGEVSTSGRNTVTASYIEALVQTKILVVSQRDAWEDHYRLFEALVGGPLVMTDRMLGMPAELKNGTSIIEYTSAAELKALILYYTKNDSERIAIATEGRRIAMSRHRSWHRMEEVVFGRPLTTCNRGAAIFGPNTACPYFVHANETLDLGVGHVVQ